MRRPDPYGRAHEEVGLRAFLRRLMPVAMRVLAGWALAAGGVLALTGMLAAVVVDSRRTDTGPGAERVFTASLTPVHSDGHAIIVPDIGALLDRHGAARLLGDGRLTITVRSATIQSSDLVAEVVPSPDALRYYGGTAHAEVLAVGYTMGSQPVLTVDRPGEAPSGAAPWEPANQSVAPVAAREVTVVLDVPTDDPAALVVRRSDDAADLTAAITVGFAPASWRLATVVLGIGGGLATLSGVALLLVRRPTFDIPDDLADLESQADRSVSPYVYTAT